MNFGHRKSIRLRGYDYSQDGAYFITICTQGHLHLFGKVVDDSSDPEFPRKMILNDLGEIVREEWLKSAEIRQEIILGKWVIMPNHFHCIVTIAEPSNGMQCQMGMPDSDAKNSNGDAKNSNGDGGISNGDRRSPVRAFGGCHFDSGGCHADSVGFHLKSGNGPIPHSVGALMAGFKSAVTRRINEMNHTPGKKLWQRNYWEHVVRNENEFDRICTYIENNPLSWGKDKLND